MDNNTQTQTPPPVPPAQTPPAPAAIVSPDEGGKGAKMMKYLLIGLVVLILLGGLAAYFYMRQSGREGTAKLVLTEDINQELNAEELESVDGDFNGVDEDLDSL